MRLKEENYKKYFGDENLIIRSKLVGTQWKVGVYKNGYSQLPNKTVLNKLQQIDCDCAFNTFNEKLFIRGVVGQSLHDELGLDSYYTVCCGYINDTTNKQFNIECKAYSCNNFIFNNFKINQYNNLSIDQQL